MTLSIGSKTDIGRVRESNQDSYAVLHRNELLGKLDALVVVADGMGGAGGDRGGEVASRIVAQTIPDAIHERITERSGATNLSHLLRDSIIRANGMVWMRQVEQPDLRGMGTTCVTALVQGDQITIGNVGDSRAYLLRDGKLIQLTEDHSDVWQEVLAGNMTREQASRSPFRNRITRAIGLHSEVKPDVETHSLQEGDTVLLCSDGLTTEVRDTEIARILASVPDTQAVCDRLVEAALHNGGSDNVTVVLLRYGVFAPLTLPDRAPAPEARTAEARISEARTAETRTPEVRMEEEADTDPLQEWRRQERPASASSGTASAANAQAANAARARVTGGSVTGKGEIGSGRQVAADARATVEEDEDEEESRWRPREADADAAEPGQTGRIVFTVIVLLTLMVIGMGIALVVASNRTGFSITPEEPVDPSVQIGRMEGPAFRPLDYAPQPALAYKEPVQDNYLAIDASANAVVLSRDGRPLRISPKGEAAPLLSQSPIPKASEAGSAAGRNGDPAARFAFTFDEAGNRYEINVAERAIDKYDRHSTRKIAGIGKGRLTAPTALAVDMAGNLYVIDAHYLKKIKAFEHGQMPNQMPKLSSSP